MSAHTPGPWHTASDHVQIRSDKHQIARVWMMRNGEGACNARLIAAAPDLLEALKAAYAALDISYPLYSCDMDKRGAVLGQARAAIAKATGAA